MHLNVFVKNNSVIRQAYLILVLINKEIRESTFISPRGGGRRYLEKSSYFYRVVQVIGKFSWGASKIFQ
jgi:hypothetical protein